MLCDPTRRERINSFALVSYVPGPLGAFLDDLRQELVPGCFLRAHISVLPPRAIEVSPEDAWRQICGVAPLFAPFEVRLTEVLLFPVSDVIYLGLGPDMDKLTEMHAVLNAKALAGTEAFEFVPHITLAQDLKGEDVQATMELARERWSAYNAARSFRIDTITFVQNTEGNNWIDLGEYRLGSGDIKLLEPMATR